MFGKLPIEGKKVVCLVSGGNIDVNILSRVINRGLLKNGRLCQLELVVPDKPGTLSHVLKVVADHGANVLSVNHERVSAASQINSCILHLELETLDNKHVERLRAALSEAGFTVRE
jgi:threonine dehydratase